MVNPGVKVTSAAPAERGSNGPTVRRPKKARGLAQPRGKELDALATATRSVQRRQNSVPSSALASLIPKDWAALMISLMLAICMYPLLMNVPCYTFEPILRQQSISQLITNCYDLVARCSLDRPFALW